MLYKLKQYILLILHKLLPLPDTNMTRQRPNVKECYKPGTKIYYKNTQEAINIKTNTYLKAQENINKANNWHEIKRLKG